jgi:hypothetical protein
VEQAPSKPPKVTFEGFEGVTIGPPQIISGQIWSAGPAVAASNPDDLDLLDSLRVPFVQWFDTQIKLDVQAVAVRLPNPRWCVGLIALHVDFCRWMFERHQVPPVLAGFRHLLEELCFEIRSVGGGEQFVSNIAFIEDVETQKLFGRQPDG